METITFKPSKGPAMTGTVVKWLKPFTNPLDVPQIKKLMRMLPHERTCNLQPLLAKTSTGTDVMPERSVLVIANNRMYWVGKSKVVDPKKAPAKELLEK